MARSGLMRVVPENSTAQKAHIRYHKAQGHLSINSKAQAKVNSNRESILLTDNHLKTGL
jgi:hypothetical protein